MAQEVRCPFCSAAIPVPEGMAGKAGTCPACAKAIAFPGDGIPPSIPPVKPATQKSSGWKVAALALGLGCGGIMMIGILAGFLLPALSHAQESARRTNCRNNVCQIELAMIQYAGEYKDEYPSALTDDNEAAQLRFERLLTLNYLNTAKVFHCPSASYADGPDVSALDGKTLTDPSLPKGTVAKACLGIDWCSYGVDPRVKHTMSSSRAVVADAPDPAYWGPTANSPGMGDPKSNSANHKHDGQNVAYNDGHIKWSPNVRDDSGIDSNIYAANRELNVDEDSNIRYGSGPNTP